VQASTIGFPQEVDSKVAVVWARRKYCRAQQPESTSWVCRQVAIFRHAGRDLMRSYFAILIFQNVTLLSMRAPPTMSMLPQVEYFMHLALRHLKEP